MLFRVFVAYNPNNQRGVTAPRLARFLSSFQIVLVHFEKDDYSR